MTRVIHRLQEIFYEYIFNKDFILQDTSDNISLGDIMTVERAVKVENINQLIEIKKIKLNLGPLLRAATKNFDKEKLMDDIAGRILYERKKTTNKNR